MIRLDCVNKIYRVTEPGGTAKRDFHALRDVSLDIENGSIYGIIGRSGAGKSTLIRCVNLLERPSSGRVFINEVEMTALGEAKLRAARRKIGMIFQSFNLLANRTVFGNIAFPLELERWSKQEIKDRVNEIALLVGIDDKLAQYPSQLSGGQKQRVGIARALANRPDLLLSDEATSALDPQTTKSVLRLLRDINEKLGLTVILITHEMDVIKEICDSVAVLDSGEVVEEGSVLKVFTTPLKSVTKELMTSVMQTRLPDSFADLKFTGERGSRETDILLQLSFFGSVAAQPIISDLVRGFDVDVNILAAHIDHIRATPCGTLIIQLSGEDRGGALDYLLDMNLKVEVIGYVARFNDITH
ncbi:MAG: methionine ABC transporter ATP-binding protein [Synergistaceae bacterium]|jgi:D-methionine transport system ATP-binding protein|nr:methionine ABC transporter ATP-binding protein [Synergistaceae bacterium]